MTYLNLFKLKVLSSVAKDEGKWFAVHDSDSSNTEDTVPLANFVV